MNRFDHFGMLVIPNPTPEEQRPGKTLAVVSHCYCPNGHDLMHVRARFNGFAGILIRVAASTGEGLLAISPIQGDKTRIALDLDLPSGEEISLQCPTCRTALPVHSTCSCGSDIVALFLEPKADFANCVGICRRIDCFNAKTIAGGELLSLTPTENP